MTSAPSQTSAYRPDIDGLRAIAVLSVLLYHAGLGFPGGFVGVDVFFVISGYLITSLILKDLHRGSFSMIEFWERRVRRILPALALVIIASLISGWFLFLPVDLRALGRSAVAQAFLSSNINFLLESGYFDQAAEIKPLLHTWSLAVEEQFYLLFPFLLVAVHRLSRASISRVILLLSLLSFALSIYCSYRYPAANFYLLPTRAWELLIGSYLAALPTQQQSPRRWSTESSSWGGLLAILAAVIFYDHTTRFPGLTALLPCVGTALIIWAGTTTQTSLSRLLASPPFVFIGLISYSLYLWHWPILAFSRYVTTDPLPASYRALLLLASLVLAILSWKLIEIPFRQRRLLHTRPLIFTFACITTALLVLSGLTLYKGEGIPSRFTPADLHYSDTSAPEYQTIMDTIKRVGLHEAQTGDFIELGAGDKRQPIQLLVWGDSHAAALLPVIHTLCKEHAIRGVAAVHGRTAPLVGYTSPRSDSMREQCIPFNDAIAQFIRSHHIPSVILAAKWSECITDSGIAQIRTGLRNSIIALQEKEEPGPSIYVLRQVPHPQWHVPRALDIATIAGRPYDDLGLRLDEYRQEFQRQNPCFHGLPAEFPNVTVLDPTELFLGKKGLFSVEANGKALFSDDNHLTAAGAAQLQPLFEPIFQALPAAPIHPDSVPSPTGK